MYVHCLKCLGNIKLICNGQSKDLHFCVHLTNIRVFRNKDEVTIFILPAGLLQDAVVVALDLLPEVAPALHDQVIPLGVDVLLLLLQVATLLQYLLLLLLLFLWKVIDKNNLLSLDPSAPCY